MGSAATRIAMLGTGHHVPERILTNQDLERMVDTSDEWIRERTGIRERHIASESEATSDMCQPAAERALADAGIGATDLDAIICATVTADNAFPSLACKLKRGWGRRTRSHSTSAPHVRGGSTRCRWPRVSFGRATPVTCSYSVRSA